MKLTENQEATRNVYQKRTINIGMRRDNLQYVFTPYSLCEEMILKLKENTGLKEKNILVFNLEFAIVLIEQGVSPGNITFLTDCIEKVAFAKFLGVAVMLEDFKKIIDEKRDLGKFDVVIGNPPYQAPQDAEGKRGGGTSLWDKFVEKALDELLKKNGYLCFVHPARWRKPEDDLWNKITQNQIFYIEIHNKQDGQKLFGATTRYDWYVLQKKHYCGPTVVIDENNDRYSVDLSKWPWLPNYAFEKIEHIITKDGNEDNIIFSRTAYGSDKDWTSPDQFGEYKHPCIHSSPKLAEMRFYYSKTNKNGHFGIPKIIFAESDNLVPIVDMDGIYGLTQQTMAIPITDKTEVHKIVSVIGSDFFRNNILLACRWSNFRIDWRMFKYFKKDFWKEFLDDIEEE